MVCVCVHTCHTHHIYIIITQPLTKCDNNVQFPGMRAVFHTAQRRTLRNLPVCDEGLCRGYTLLSLVNSLSHTAHGRCCPERCAAAGPSGLGFAAASLTVTAVPTPELTAGFGLWMHELAGIPKGLRHGAAAGPCASEGVLWQHPMHNQCSDRSISDTPWNSSSAAAAARPWPRTAPLPGSSTASSRAD
jgi:hypothetical protein